MEDQNCPCCDAKIKTGMFGSNTFITKAKTDVINEYHSPQHEKYCESCGNKLFQESSFILEQEIKELTEQIRVQSPKVPLVTFGNPNGWQYKVIGLVTSQSTTGTGALFEFNTELIDFFGAQSSGYNMKLKNSEEKCARMIRVKTIGMGGNAVLGVTIHYEEVGGNTGMLMVCISGTAVLLENPEVVSDQFHDESQALINAMARAKRLKALEGGK